MPVRTVFTLIPLRRYTQAAKHAHHGCPFREGFSASQYLTRFDPDGDSRVPISAAAVARIPATDVEVGVVTLYSGGVSGIGICGAGAAPVSRGTVSVPPPEVTGPVVDGGGSVGSAGSDPSGTAGPGVTTTDPSGVGTVTADVVPRFVAIQST